jgi:hypothetical protein
MKTLTSVTVAFNMNLRLTTLLWNIHIGCSSWIGAGVAECL